MYIVHWIALMHRKVVALGLASVASALELWNSTVRESCRVELGAAMPNWYNPLWCHHPIPLARNLEINLGIDTKSNPRFNHFRTFKQKCSGSLTVFKLIGIVQLTFYSKIMFAWFWWNICYETWLILIAVKFQEFRPAFRDTLRWVETSKDPHIHDHNPIT